MSELAAIDRWLYGVLAGDTTLVALLGKDSDNRCVFDTIASPGAVEPYIVFQMQSARDVTYVNGQRTNAEATYLVKAMQQAESFGTLRTIADRIDTLLHRQNGTNDDGTVMSCVREQPFKYVELYEGVQYRQMGGFYRIRSQ